MTRLIGQSETAYLQLYQRMFYVTNNIHGRALLKWRQ